MTPLRESSCSSQMNSAFMQEKPALDAIAEVASVLFKELKNDAASIPPPTKKRKIEARESSPGQKKEILLTETIIFPEGSICERYEGSTKNGKPEGPGKIFFSDGKSFEGTFAEGLIADGPGKFTSPNGITVKGVCLKSETKILLTISYPEGYCIEGYFEKGAAFQGKVVYSRWLKYKPYQKLIYGENLLGKLVWPAGSVFEEISDIGSASDLNGFFKVSTSIEVTSTKDLTWKDFTEKVPLSGTIVYPPGSSVKLYKGLLEAGLPSGPGEMHYTNGDVDFGFFKNGILHGRGKRIFQTGKVYLGQWIEGEFVKGTLILPNGKFFAGIFENEVSVQAVEESHPQELSPYNSAIF